MKRTTSPYSPSPEALRQQLQKANDKTGRLEAENASLKAELGRNPDRLLNELAAALLLAEEISDPQQAHTYDPTGIKRSTEPPIPGSSTAAQRRAANHLRTQLHRAVNEFESARQRNWQKRERIPKVRCVNRDCNQKNRRVPAWDHRGPIEFCAGCGQKLHPAEAPGGELYRSPSHVQE